MIFNLFQLQELLFMLSSWQECNVLNNILSNNSVYHNDNNNMYVIILLSKILMIKINMVKINDLINLCFRNGDVVVVVK